MKWREINEVLVFILIWFFPISMIYIVYLKVKFLFDK